MKWLEDHIEGVVFSVIIGLVLLLVLGLIAWNREYDRLMAQCLQDHKEYECRSILDGSGSTTLVPVVIPVR